MAGTTEQSVDVGNMRRTERPKEPVYCFFPQVHHDSAFEDLSAHFGAPAELRFS